MPGVWRRLAIVGAFLRQAYEHSLWVLCYAPANGCALHGRRVDIEMNTFKYQKYFK